MHDLDRTTVRRVPSAALSAGEVRALRDLLWRAFGSGDERFTEDDWQHALGGEHFLAELEARIVGHAAVVERTLQVGGRRLRTGYVEAVAVDPDVQGRGVGTRLMEAVTDFVRGSFELGALGTGRHRFYERLGWRTWLGASSVRQPDGGLQATPDEDGFILVLATPSSPALDWTAPIACDWRPGDAW
jgi:aminoglycoside 2'-N-acetyltransferase I